MSSYNLDYGQRPTTVIAFRLTGDDLRPQLITQALGIASSKAWAKGDVRKRPGNYYTFGCWALNPSCSKYEPFEVQLNQLLGQLEALPPALKDFVKRFDGEISIGFSSGGDTFGFAIDHRLMERLCQFGVALDFDIYAIHEEDDDKKSA